MKIPLNRVVAFAGPYIATVAGALAAWLVGHVNVLALPGLGGRDRVATLIASGLTGVLVSGLTWLGHSKWLKGHHISIEAEARLNAAAIVAGEPPPGEGPDVEAIDDEDLPEDDEEMDEVPELWRGEALSGQDPGSPPLRPAE